MIDFPLLLILNREDLETKYDDYILISMRMQGKKTGMAIKGSTERLMDKLGLLILARYSVHDRNINEELFDQELINILEEVDKIEKKIALTSYLLPMILHSIKNPSSLNGIWKNYISSHKKISDKIKQLGAEAFLHANGDYGPYFNDLDAIWDVLHPLDGKKKPILFNYHLYPKLDLNSMLEGIKNVLRRN